jgi:uncharacterized protein YidB (DUF937 family)
VISRFEATGLGNHVQSRVSSGQNMPVPADQIRAAFPPNK